MIQFNLSVREIADLVNGRVVGNDNSRITRIEKIEDAVDGDLTFLASAKFAKFLESTSASCIIVGSDAELNSDPNRSYVLCDDPHRAINGLIRTLTAQSKQGSGSVHTATVVAASAAVSSTAQIDPGVIVGEHCQIGDLVHLHCNVILGNGVRIESGTIIYSNATIYDDCKVGRNCIIHANAVIGSDGFGYLDNPDGSYEKIIQIGNVVIEDDVEIGAGTCIDRAALGSTVIRRGVKIDNLVHIAHNVEIGEHTAIAAQTGIAGGTKIGARNRIAGQVGIVGYITTVDDVTIGAQSGVSKSISLPGVYSGSPAVELRQRLKQEAALRRLT